MLIDTHTHTLTDWTEDGVTRCFEDTGVDRILLAALPLDHWGDGLTPDCARLMERFPDKVSGLIGIHPPNIDQSLRDIENYHKKGFIGIKLMPTAGYYPDDEKYRAIFEEVNARKMIVMSHCGWCSAGKKAQDLPQSTRFSHPYHFEPLVRLFKDTDFIFAHGGGRTMFQAAFELSQYHKNVWIDTCPGQGTWILQHAGIWLNVLNWDNLLFGTDMNYGKTRLIDEGYFKEVEMFVRNAINIAGFRDKTDGVMGGNAKRLLEKHGVQF